MAPSQIEPGIAAGSGPTDERIADLAARQHGVISRRQLLELGLSRHQVQLGLTRRRLHPLHLGVYAVGHRRVTRHGLLTAAVLACGQGALISHLDAADLWGMLERGPGPIHVTVARGRCGRRPGIVVHRPRTLDAEDRRRRWGIPLTAPARTLTDLAGVLGPSALRRAVDAAAHRDLLDPDRVLALCGGGTRGTARLRQLVERHRPLPETRSELERMFLRLCDDAAIRRPAVNVGVEGYEVDCYWPAERLVVELDGFAHHSDLASFRADRKRDAALQLAGLRVLRFTFDRLAGEPDAVIAEMRRGLLG